MRPVFDDAEVHHATVTREGNSYRITGLPKDWHGERVVVVREVRRD